MASALTSDHHVEATTSLVDRALRTLKHGDLFGTFARNGGCRGGKDGPDGLFYKDTRYISEYSLSLGGVEPLLLSSVVLDDNAALIIDQTNTDLAGAHGVAWLPRDSLFIGRMKFLRRTTAYERITIRRIRSCSRANPSRGSLRIGFCRLVRSAGRDAPAAGDAHQKYRG